MNRDWSVTAIAAILAVVAVLVFVAVFTTPVEARGSSMRGYSSFGRLSIHHAHRMTGRAPHFGRGRKRG